MTSMTATRQVLAPKDVKGWPDAVATALLTIVNNRGVKFRLIDGNHFLLYPPDRDQRPVKFSRSRGEKDNLRYLEMFVDNHLGPYVPEVRDDRPATEKELETLTALNTSAQQKREKAAEEWHPYIPKGKTEPSPVWETNGRVFRCTICHEITATGNLGTHAANHVQAAALEAARVETPHLKEIRLARGFTLEASGRHFGMTGAGYGFWEKKGFVDRKYVADLIAYLGITEEILTAEKMPARLPAMPKTEEAPKPEIRVPAPASAEPLRLVAEPEATSADVEPSGPSEAVIVPEDAPEAPSEAPEPLPAVDADTTTVLLTIQRLAAEALGAESVAADLLAARARIAELENQLSEVHALLDLMRETVGGVGR